MYKHALYENVYNKIAKQAIATCFTLSQGYYLAN